MNTAEGVRRLAQVIRGGSTVLAGILFLGCVVIGFDGGEEFFIALVYGVIGALVIVAIGHSVA
jgi:hypothetical protein